VLIQIESVLQLTRNGVLECATVFFNGILFFVKRTFTALESLNKETSITITSHVFVIGILAQLVSVSHAKTCMCLDGFFTRITDNFYFELYERLLLSHMYCMQTLTRHS